MRAKIKVLELHGPGSIVALQLASCVTLEKSLTLCDL
jgi:hypothetical protein